MLPNSLEEYETVSTKTTNKSRVPEILNKLGDSFDLTPQSCVDLVFISQFVANTLGIPFEDYMNICKTTWESAENFTKKALVQYEDY